MLFNSVKEINRLRKEIHRLLSKEMPNIYYEVTIEVNNCSSQNFYFLGLSNCHHVSFGELQLTKTSLNFKTSCCNLRIRYLVAKLMMMMMMIWWWWRWWITFVVWLIDESGLALFPARTIVRDAHHREFSTGRDTPRTVCGFSIILILKGIMAF